MKAIRWLLKLVLVMITLPLILAVWLAKWFVVFLHHCCIPVSFDILKVLSGVSHTLQIGIGRNVGEIEIPDLCLISHNTPQGKLTNQPDVRQM